MEQRYVLHLFFFPPKKVVLGHTHNTRSRELSTQPFKSVGQVHEVFSTEISLISAPPFCQTKAQKSPVVSRLVTV